MSDPILTNREVSWTAFGGADLIIGDVNATGLRGAIGSDEIDQIIRSSAIEWHSDNADSLLSALKQDGGALQINLLDMIDQNMSPFGIKRQFQRFEGIFKQMKLSRLSVGDQVNLSTGLTGTSQSKYTGRNSAG